jgi:hypothetical protein
MVKQGAKNPELPGEKPKIESLKRRETRNACFAIIKENYRNSGC